MTTLAANLSATATSMRVNAGVSDPAEYYQIGDEIIRLASARTVVNDPPPSPNRSVDETLWAIAERGVGTTAAASHTSGATVTPLSVGGGSSGIQTMSLLHLTADKSSSGIFGTPGAAIGTLPAQTIALSCYVALSGDWTATDAQEVPLEIGVETGTGTQLSLYTVSDIAGESDFPLADVFSALSSPAQLFWASVIVGNLSDTPRTIRARVGNASGIPATNAKLDVFIFIAEPA